MTGTPDVSGAVGPRLNAARRLAGHGAAASLSLYLVVKVGWVAAALFGHAPPDFGSTDWVVLNLVTVAMSAAGIVLGVVLAQGPKWHIPTAPLVFFAWVGSGFLVPLLPYAMVSAALGAGGDDGDSAPSWELTLIAIGFTGMAVGLAIALPIYMRERWPGAYLGRLTDRKRLAARPARTASLVLTAPTVLWTYWSLGGTLGLDPAHRDLIDVNARLLLGNSALWALLGLWAIWAITSARPNMPVWLPTTLAFTASGSLFAWGGWRLAVALLRPGGYAPAEYPAVTVVEHSLAIAGGTLMLAILVKSIGDGRLR
ncbi:hypothetical protein E1293_38755 [Actinomadura darangshiensis]|uniref:Uncharacterized protein n=1 Tax=Actinomadura darangshiensis TaxID=705336 RepID=A0A4R5A5D0_9ACTN|nr:hypothetical protein [Actinomadura darangshiensis]TDD66775.1 hypothetical protein E1293_38755 [Actinomadura darangshiensis]